MKFPKKLESKLGGIGLLKLLFQTNLFDIVKSLMSKMIFPLSIVGFLYPRYQVIQTMSYDMNVWTVVLHNCRNENEKMKNINIWNVVPKYYLEVSIMNNYYFNLVSQYEILIYQPKTYFEKWRVVLTIQIEMRPLANLGSSQIVNCFART